MNTIDIVHWTEEIKEDEYLDAANSGPKINQPFRVGKCASNFRSEKKADNVGSEQNGKFGPEKNASQFQY